MAGVANDFNQDVAGSNSNSAVGADGVGGSGVGVVSAHTHAGRSATVGGESSALISMIERAARDPNIDIDKMERLFTMHERMTASRSRMDYDAAFAALQTELPEIDKKGKITIKEKGGDKIIQSTPYALWDDTNKLIKPILAKYGFGLSFRISQTEARLTTKAVLSHVGGHREETEFSSPIDATGSKNNVQGWGSAFSYGKRYTGTAILNITTKGEDDDAKAAGASATINDDQADELRTMLMEPGQSIQSFLAYMKVESISDISSADFERAKTAIRTKGKKSNG